MQRRKYSVIKWSAIAIIIVTTLALLSGVHFLHGSKIPGIVKGAFLNFIFPIISVLLVYFVLYLLYIKFGQFRFLKKIIAFHEWRGDEKILNIAPGLGLIMADIAKRLTTGKCVGVNNFNNKQALVSLELLKANLTIEGVTEKTEIINADFANAGFASSSFDVIIFNILAIEKLHNDAYRASFFAELSRVMNANGKIIILYWGRSQKLVMSLLLNKLIVQKKGNFFLTALFPFKIIVAGKNEQILDAVKPNFPRQTKRIALITFIALAVFIFSFVVIKSFQVLSNLAAIPMLYPTYEMPAEDSGIISKKYITTLRVEKVYQSAFKHPVASFFVDSTYRLTIYKINVKNGVPFKNLITIQQKKAKQSLRITYQVLDNNNFGLKSMDDRKILPISRLYFTFKGKNFSYITGNDSLVSYHLNCRNFSIRYADTGPNDIIFETNDDSWFSKQKPIPLDILFLAQNNAVYFLFMAPLNKNASIPPGLLYNIVTGR